jgi:tRNA pseudouridine38-40 synthase
VQGEIERGLSRFHVPGAEGTVSVASRTDRGVSAAGNALALESELPGPSVLRALNGISPVIYFTRCTRITQEFRVRSATRRVYRYFEPTPASHLATWREAARLFSGTIDVRSLGRGLPSGREHRRAVDRVDVRVSSGRLELEVIAPSFVWGMVRKIVGALREVDAGRLPLSRLASVLRGHERLTLPMAEPEPLVLWDVEYPIEWEYAWVGPTRPQARWWEEARNELVSRGRLLESLIEGSESGPARASPPAPNARASAPR